MMQQTRRYFVAGLMLALLPTQEAISQDGQRESLVLATTTSVENSGLLAFLLQQFHVHHDVEVKVVARGTGQAFQIARNGDADLVLAHHPSSEEHFVGEGYGVRRVPLMYNYFTLVGPKGDPAKILGAENAFVALTRIARAGERGEAIFVSRGDESGTHRRERELWLAAGEIINSRDEFWYLETGAGMGATLNIASELEAYTLTDRGTWLSFGNKRGLDMLLGEAEALFNPYSLILVNPEKHDHVAAQAAGRFVDWLVSQNGQRAIGEFRIGDETSFFPARVDTWEDAKIP